jgi:hypothetical protein
VNSIATKSSTVTGVKLPEEDCRRLIDVFREHSDAFRDWERSGANRRDIESIHARNVLGSIERKVDYRKLKKELMDAHGVSEYDMMVSALRWFAAPSR